MASPTLTITLTTSSTCSDITVIDSTADYGSGTVTVNQCQRLVMVVNLAGGSYLTFTFTLVNGVITASTLGLSGATPVSIQVSLQSTVWPFVATPFSIWRAYGVTVPAFADGVVEVDYTITGHDGNGTAFTYSTSSTKIVVCSSLCCCVATNGQKLDINCECEDCLWKFLKLDAYVRLATMSANNVDRAQLFIDKATALCDCNCTGC